jgi:peptide chain release factor 3
MQILYETDAQRREPILAVVGILQFEVVQAGLESEYNVKTRLNMLPHTLCRLVQGPAAQIDALPWRYSMIRAQDSDGRLVALMTSPHELKFYDDKYPQLIFTEIS